MSLLLIAFIAGLFSVLTPCILPVLPALLVVSEGQGRARIAGLVVGVVGSFCIAILLLTALIDALGIPDDVLRYVSAGLLIAFALVLLVPALDDKFQMAAQVLVRAAPAQNQSNGFVGGLLAGATLGLVWAPCAGPILASITSGIAREGLSSDAVVATIGYGLGMAIPLTGVIFGGRALVGKLRRVTGNGRRINQAMGVILLATGLLFLSGFDNRLNRIIADKLPFTSTPVASLERRATDGDSGARDAESCAEAEAYASDSAKLIENGYPETEDLCDLGPMPKLAGLGKTSINTPDGKPLDMGDLTGKVVLVDFWTYSCINCIRTLPYLRAWDEQYRDDGLVILGVHTPEFGFEKSLDNVRDAVDDLDVTWPVAQDNDYDTWNNFGNRFWPAKYLIDRDGTVRLVHYGEGSYAETEAHIRTLLDVSEGEAKAATEQAPEIEVGTRETYLGYGRGAGNFIRGAVGAPAVGSGFVTEEPARYVPEVATLEQNDWTYDGTWTVERERAVAGPGAKLRIRFAAREAYLVMSPPPRSSGATVVPLVEGARRAGIRVEANKLYTVASDPSAGVRELELAVPEGVAVYAFTFG
ncbi:MAG: hypothetical protein JWM90_863 [Thermoleophilia bacterium]|nr:hypothetical protein [Thermoleophilia bacterium]